MSALVLSFLIAAAAWVALKLGRRWILRWRLPKTVFVTLDATEPEELIRALQPFGPSGEGVWLRRGATTVSGWPEVNIWGDRAAVLEFIQDNWGVEEVDRLREEGLPF